MTREQATEAAKLLDRIAGGRYSERLAEVNVAGHVIDVRQFERPARRTQRKAR